MLRASNLALSKDLGRLHDILNFPTAKTKHQLGSFLGLVIVKLKFQTSLFWLNLYMLY